MAANVARAIAAGIPARPGAEPPALYSFDPGAGRLAVTTPRYNTAITAITNGAYPYGGIDLARLYDGRQEIAATLGARVPVGLRHRRPQPPRPDPARHLAPRVQPLRAAAAAAARAVGRRQRRLDPAAVRRAVRRAARDGPARRRRRRRALDLHVPPQLDHRRVDGARPPRSRRRSAEALFPSTGGERAAVWALLRDGQAVQVTGTRPVMGVAAFWVQSERSGYVVEPIDRVKGATASIVQPHRQPSAPDPGPTLSVRLTGRLVRKRPVHFSVRITPAADLASARAAAAR